MATLPTFRFRTYTRESVGAYTVIRASSQADALADLQRQLAPWEFAAPLYGPNRCPQWFD